MVRRPRSLRTRLAVLLSAAATTLVACGDPTSDRATAPSPRSDVHGAVTAPMPVGAGDDGGVAEDAGGSGADDAGSPSLSGAFGSYGWTTVLLSAPSQVYETTVTLSGAYFATIQGPFYDSSGNAYGVYSDATYGNVQTGYPTPSQLAPLTPTYGNFMAYMAAEVQPQLGMQPQAAGDLGNDHQGCDAPAAGYTANCGGCCDTHDVCYCQNGCTAHSWFGIQGAACFACNLSVVGCITSCVWNGNNNPSSCVATSSCGQGWEECDDNGTLCDPAAKPPWGQCMQIQKSDDGKSATCTIEKCPEQAVQQAQ